MKRTVVSGPLVALFTFLIASLVCAEEQESKSPKALEVTKSTPKLEIRASQIGYRDTLLFYVFKDQNAVLKLQIGNEDKSFPMTGTIFFFADSAGQDGLDKWVNNQHSDGLFPDVPEPIGTHHLPANICDVASHKLIDRSKQTFGEYETYLVTFKVKDHTDGKSVTLKEFSDTAKVHVKTK